MIFRNRPLARLGATALLASGVFTALAGPAHASGTETDLSLDVVGTRVAAGAEGKIAFAKITNNGKNIPGALAVKADLSKVDFDKVAPVPAADECEFEGEGETPTSWTCTVPKGALPGPGETIEVPVVIFKTGELDGTYSAPVRFTLVSTDDTDESNNTKDATVELTDESGADLTVLAPDVKQAVKVSDDGEISIVGDLHAGQTAQLQYLAINQGDRATAGLKITVKLPTGVTFTEVEEGCEYDKSNTEARCTYADFPFVPVTQDNGDNDDVYSGGDFYHLLSVGADVKVGSLTGGSVTVEPIMPSPAAKNPSVTTTELPENVEGINGADVDASDNTDGYAVVVSAKGGAGGGDGGLPVTGPQAGLLGGVGAAVLAAGAAMFLVARRRRVVLVTPGDEKPTA